jgi:two-component system CheB/CheR fusion protein
LQQIFYPWSTWPVLYVGSNFENTPYALKPNGILWLGKSESTGGVSKLFTLVDKTHKIYVKTNVPSPMNFRFLTGASVPETPPISLNNIEMRKVTTDFQKDADRIALEKYAPPSVVINTDMEILYFRGRTTPYLEHESGPSSNNLLKMAKPELLHALRQSIHKAIKQNTVVRQDDLAFDYEGKRRTINIEVVPANPFGPADQRKFIIFFETVNEAPLLPAFERQKNNNKNGTKRQLDHQDQRIEQLIQEARINKHYQMSMIEEFNAAREELTAGNEELQSTNEELQSTNEELETAKEEVQSSNEELSTVNDELQSRNVELIALSSDLNNILTSVGIPLVIVGNDHCIRHFTPQAEKTFKLIASDIGRPLGDITTNLDLDLGSLISKVIKTLNTIEREIQDSEGRWIRLQIRPYKTIDNRIDGAVVILVDIGVLKQSLETTDSALKYATSVTDTIQIPFVVLDHERRIKSANLFFYEYFKLTTDVVGRKLFHIIKTDAEHISKLKEILNQALSSHTSFNKFEINYQSETLENRRLLLSGKRIMWSGSEFPAILLALEDVTDQLKTQDDLEKMSINLRKALESRDEFLSVASHELKTPVTTLKMQLQMSRRTVNSDLVTTFAPAKLVKALDLCISQVDRISTLIDDLLDVTRIESGKMKYHFESVDISQLVHDITEQFSPQLKLANCIMEVKLCENAIIFCDRFRIEQVLINLIINAAKYGAGSLVRIELYRAQHSVKISVSDNGIGIAKEKQQHIFNRFERAVSLSNISGLGLGLYITKQIVDAHGGNIELISALGKGSKFTVELPIDEKSIL